MRQIEMNAVVAGNWKWVHRSLAVVLAPQIFFYVLFMAQGIVGGSAHGHFADRGALVPWAQIVIVLSALAIFFCQKEEPALRLTERGRRLAVGSSVVHFILIVLMIVYSVVFGDEVSSSKPLYDPILVFGALNVGMVWVLGVICSLGQLSPTLDLLTPRSAETAGASEQES